jgi:hypothetical protein
VQSGHWKYRTGLPAVAQLVIVTWQCVHSIESIWHGDITGRLRVNKAAGITGGSTDRNASSTPADDAVDGAER